MNYSAKLMDLTYDFIERALDRKPTDLESLVRGLERDNLRDALADMPVPEKED